MSDQLSATGIITKITDIQTGVSKAGNEWQKREFVIETEGQFPKNICFTLFGDNVDFILPFSNGDMVRVLFNVESREYNGRWFHNVNAYNVSKIGENATPTNLEYKPKSNHVPNDINSASLESNDDQEDDLPF